MKAYYYSKEALIEYLIYNISEYREYLESEKKWRHTNRTYHTELGCLLHFVDDKIEHNHTKYLPFIFDLIEELAKYGSDNTRNAVWTIFLEGLSNRIKGDEEKYLSVDLNKYLGPASIQMMKEIDDFWGDNTEELKYVASITPFLLESLNSQIEGYSKFREQDIKKWNEEGQVRPLPVEMTTLLEFVKIKLANNDHETVTKILDSVKETAEYATKDAYFHQLLEHWYNLLEKQQAG